MKCKYEGTGVWTGRCIGTKEVEPCRGHDKCEMFVAVGEELTADKDIDVVEAVRRLRKYCVSFGSCSFGCMFFDTEARSCKLDNPPYMWGKV